MFYSYHFFTGDKVLMHIEGRKVIAYFQAKLLLWILWIILTISGITYFPNWETKEEVQEREREGEKGEKRHAGTFPISGSWAAALLSPIVAIMTGDATAAATTCSRATTSTSTKATTTTTAATTNTTTTRTTTTTGHKLTAVCWCLRLPSLPMFYASAYKYTPIHTQTLTDTHSQIHRHVHFSIFFSPRRWWQTWQRVAVF